mmetsp:Transcript_44601/g.129731  ORF Transcript_44601/g.129731 Transcript_44601/m.129731 type:complete len:278 (+) Transcript_44601:1029-1862(+)
MKGCEIPVGDAVILIEVAIANPGRLIGVDAHAHPMPHACEDMVQPEYQTHSFHHLRPQLNVLRLQLFDDVMEEGFQLREAQKPDGAEHPYEAQRPADAHQAGATVSVEEPGHPIRADDADIKHEPCSQVALRDLPQIQDHIPSVVKAGEEGARDIDHEVRHFKPEHNLQERDLLYFEGELERYRDEVVGDPCNTQSVPSDAFFRRRVQRTTTRFLRGRLPNAFPAGLAEIGAHNRLSSRRFSALATWAFHLVAFCTGEFADGRCQLEERLVQLEGCI